jgi:hypothetical protein
LAGNGRAFTGFDLSTIGSFPPFPALGTGLVIILATAVSGGEKISGSEIMFNVNIKQGVLAAMAAIILTATAVGAAVGPARAIETAPAASPLA